MLLNQKVKSNLNVATKSKTVKKGKLVDSTDKIPKSNSRVVGVAKGVTLNMGDYESMRIDVWASDFIKDNETISQAETRIAREIDALLEKECNKIPDRKE